MTINKFSDTVLLPTKRDVLRVHLYFKLVQHGIRPFEKHMDIIIELYLFGGYNNDEEQRNFISLCLNKGMKGSAQSLRNLLSRYTTLGVFEHPKNSVLHLSNHYIPPVECDRIVLKHIISNAE